MPLLTRHVAASCCLWLLLGSLAHAELRLELEGIAQPQLPRTDKQFGGSLAAELEFHRSVREAAGTNTLDVVLFAREDSRSPARSHADLRELIYSFSAGDLELRFGYGRVFWGVTEGAHLVDIVNQDDALENLDGEDKLGQPLLNLAWSSDFGIWRGYLLPHFRPRRFPEQAVFPIPFEIQEQQARYESPRGEQHVDVALRWQDYFGPVDVAVSWFDGTAREPRLLPCAAQGSGRPGTQDQANCDLDTAFAPPPAGPLDELLLDLGALLGVGPDRQSLEDEFIAAALADVVLLPQYDQIRQWGLELQAILGGWALKFEGRRRDQLARAQHAFAAGVEYTRAAPFGLPADFGYIAEYLFDDRASAQFVAPFNNDLLLGWRALFSDVAGTQLLAGVVQDLDQRGRIISLEGSRRLPGGNTRVELEWRVFSDFEAANSMGFLSHTDELRLRLSQYF